MWQRTVKHLVKEKGIHSAINPKPGETLDTTVGTVNDFYNHGVIGIKDKLNLQKGFISKNLNEAYYIFEEENPD